MTRCPNCGWIPLDPDPRYVEEEPLAAAERGTVARLIQVIDAQIAEEAHRA